jgi:hypothetical protein
MPFDTLDLPAPTRRGQSSTVESADTLAPDAASPGRTETTAMTSVSPFSAGPDGTLSTVVCDVPTPGHQRMPCTTQQPVPSRTPNREHDYV